METNSCLSSGPEVSTYWTTVVNRWSEGMSLDGDGHPSATGHKEIARRVARDILQETTRVEASQ